MTAFSRLLLPENVNYAWQKAKRLYRTSDGYVDHGELAEFELDLELRLKRIRQQFEKGSYRTKSLRALPRPKKIKDGEPVNRQYYDVAVEDQVAWIAVVNALGPKLDQMMPSWSYGNRLYRAAWYEERENRQSKLEIGPYRHASGHLYRKFQHSWPLFRRHVALTARMMVRHFNRDDLDLADELAVASAEAEKLSYLDARFWLKSTKHARNTDLYYASIDLKEFYPSIRSDAVLHGLSISEIESREEDKMHALLKSMLRFRLDKTNVPETAMGQVEPRFGGQLVKGIPTGLFVAGFLANAAMLTIDNEVNRRILNDRSVAHFRFVDDHTILAYDFDALCDWIDSYKSLLAKHSIGPKVNEEKYDPENLADWMAVRVDAKLSDQPSERKEDDPKRQGALTDTKIDGANPTKLLTKTLGQVSAIAAANTDILDDEDLEERLKLLEWLLLADIPERELRPDTRAAFAAGQIAKLAPILVQEADTLVDEARALALLESQTPKSDSATAEALEAFNARHKKKVEEIAALQADNYKNERRRLRNCFRLLLQAFTEYPSKARLFYRLLQYCRLTGHDGLSDVAAWIKRTREQGRVSWADYYCGLTLQILADGILRAVRTATRSGSLRSYRIAALRHLEDIAGLKVSIFSIPPEREAWFHTVGRLELAVCALAAAETLREHGELKDLSQRLKALSARYVEISFADSSAEWVAQTGCRPGVWAHLVEPALTSNGMPSPTWRRFQSCFNLGRIADRRAARRYPEVLSDKGWSYFLQSKSAVRETDSGWVSEALADNEQRSAEARASTRRTYRRAVRTLDPSSHEWISITEWTHFVATECSAFDPRPSEWTALEIVRQVIAPVEQLGFQKRLDRIHPNNVLVPAVWKTGFEANPKRAGVSWEGWRSFIARTDGIKFLGRGKSILDYRYLTYTQSGPSVDRWERRLTAVGRLLLGLLKYDHDAPRIWNIRGNERVVPLPLASIFRSLAISSPTLLLVEGCLSGRSAETRAIARRPGLFGWREGDEVNDARFDPPLLRNPNELLQGVKRAQEVLAENQLAVSMNQPRQLIPVRLSDFATGSAGEVEDDANGE